jgi:hypothetical protein
MNNLTIIAKANPSRKYKWFSCFENVRLEARLTDTGRHSFYEINLGLKAEKRISADTVKTLFRSDCRVCDRPFLIKENQQFYSILSHETEVH